MTLPTTGEISANAINIELQKNGTDSLELNSAEVRYLAGKTTGAISFTDFYGRTRPPAPVVKTSDDGLGTIVLTSEPNAMITYQGVTKASGSSWHNDTKVQYSGDAVTYFPASFTGTFDGCTATTSGMVLPPQKWATPPIDDEGSTESVIYYSTYDSNTHSVSRNTFYVDVSLGFELEYLDGDLYYIGESSNGGITSPDGVVVTQPQRAYRASASIPAGTLVEASFRGMKLETDTHLASDYAYLTVSFTVVEISVTSRRSGSGGW